MAIVFSDHNILIDDNDFERPSCKYFPNTSLEADIKYALCHDKENQGFIYGHITFHECPGLRKCAASSFCLALECCMNNRLICTETLDCAIDELYKKMTVGELSRLRPYRLCGFLSYRII